ncbi:hypothetical protein ANO11243_081540 [Dothideomycetidae sp. 11243]|nr:hypothetical protein ANO11243_081540 [fungal sp. No.11243]
MSSSTTHPAQSLLSRAHSPSTTTQIYESHIKHRPLLLRPSSPDPSSQSNKRTARRAARQLLAQKQKRRKPKPLSAKVKRKLGVYSIGPAERKWGLYTGLHALWCGYMRDILGLSEDGKDGGKARMQADTAGPLLASADYHGCLIAVVRSGCVSRVGIRGIVVKDCRHVFEIVTRRDRVVTVPKEGTVFRFEVPRRGNCLDLEAGRDGKEEKEEDGLNPLVFEIHGDNFRTSAPDRANRKFKQHIDSRL